MPTRINSAKPATNTVVIDGFISTCLVRVNLESCEPHVPVMHEEYNGRETKPAEKDPGGPAAQTARGLRRDMPLAPRRPRWHVARILEDSVSGTAMENLMTDPVTLEIFSDYV